MLVHPTLNKLRTLRLSGMAKALEEQQQMPDIDALGFEDRLGLLVDRELTVRDSRRLTNRLRRARLHHPAVLEDIDYTAARGLDKGLIDRLSDGRWLAEHLNLLITGPTGIGKSWLACAFAHHACRLGHTARYVRLPRLLQELVLAKGDGRYASGSRNWPKPIGWSSTTGPCSRLTPSNAGTCSRSLMSVTTAVRLW